MSYRCPLCENVVSVLDSVAGDKVECPSCGRLFVAELPRATPILGTGDVRGVGGSEVRRTADDESVIEVIHPAVFRSHLFGFLFSLVLVFGGGVGVWFGIAMLATPAGLAFLGGGALAILIGLFFIAKWSVVSRATQLSLTTERLVYREGIFNHRTSEVRYEDVRNITLDLSLRERLLGYGDLSVSSAGQDDMEIVIHDIPKPEQVAERIRREQ